ncbi:MAG: aminomethyltransferase family protein [Candidatus Promineifilaceae bacterium]
MVNHHAVKRSPFHDRLAPLNQSEIWEHWAGYLAAPRYQYSDLTEYYSTRNSAAVFDTSPLFKYRFAGKDAEAYLGRVLARDIRKCRMGQAQYTVWCNEAGYVMEDGVIMRISADEYWLTSAEPNLRYFKKQAKGFEVTIEDTSTRYGILAIQGPHSLSVLGQLSDDVAKLRYFRLTQTQIAGADVTISRTGFTGDLGYEIWIKSEDALTVWDAIWEAGLGYNLTPIGSVALSFARIEAGLLLIDVDFHNARFAWTDAQRETPHELGWGWMFKKLKSDDRDFIGRAAIEKEIATGSSRWKTVGLAVDWQDYDRLHREAGIMTPKDGMLVQDTMSIYRRSDIPWQYAGYASSFMWSSLKKQHVAIAKLPLDLCEPGTEVELEISIIRQPQYVLARVVELPFFNPKRKTARQA